MKTSKEIRNEFIEFFKNKDHAFAPSWPTIPQNDPTLLFTNAGMNQFKDILLGKTEPSFTRAVNSQRCIRVSGKHNDLEEVGHDTYHHTFFEMLGNWSFGDYYKKEAIQWAWELLTEKWRLPKDKLWATVYKDDDEAAKLWPEVTDIDPERVLRFGNKDNFWEMGATGPCGPCSEIHIDLGENFCDMKDVPGHKCSVNGDCGRYIELWNLVFVQYNRDEKGKLHPLPNTHVDTGMGFERIVSVIQGVYDNYKTDIFIPIIKTLEKISGIDYEKTEDKAPFHVIADHIRMLTFSIGDGGLPSNEGRGYVIRRILRRASRYARKLNLSEPVLYKLVPSVIDILGEAFPEIRERKDFIQKVIKSEEESFNKTLDRGLELFAQLSGKLLKENHSVIPGKEVFKLYDTFGFPPDLTRVLAEEKGMEIDEDGFTEEMNRQKQKARKAGNFKAEDTEKTKWIIVNKGEHSIFNGYNNLQINTRIAKYAETEDHWHIVLQETPFYAESGGQVGDKGEISDGANTLEVIDCIKSGNDIIHICAKSRNFIFNSEEISARVNTSVRRNTMRNHTATHLLHAALREVLGNHVQQSGSLVEPERLRFDFTHFTKVSDEQIALIEKIVNEKIEENLLVKADIKTLKEAKEEGATALFGEKYGDEFRMITIGGFSKELCGGTHVNFTGQIGSFIVTVESAIAGGIRRIEAVTGDFAVQYWQNHKRTVHTLSKLLNVNENDLAEKITTLLEDKKKLEKEIKTVKAGNILSDISSLLEKAENINDINLIIATYENIEINLLKELGDKIRSNNGYIGLLINKNDNGKLNFVCVVSDDLVKNRNLKAGDLVKEVAIITGGGGGGRPHMATAGGNNADKLPEAIKRLKEILQ